MIPGPIMVDGVKYIFDGNVHKQSRRFSLYLQNKVGARFIIKSDACDSVGDKLLDYVAIYVHVDDQMSNEYSKWWNEFIKSED